MNKLLRLFLIIIVLAGFAGCTKTPPPKEPVSKPVLELTRKLTPVEIRNLASLERGILSGEKSIRDVIEEFVNGDYYQVIGISDAPGKLPMKKLAAKTDAKRWGAIFMKFLLKGDEDLDLRGEYVDFLTFEGEYFDQSNNTVYVIYRFKKEVEK